MTTHLTKTFRGQYDRGGAVFDGQSFQNCEFISCGFSLTKKVSERSIVRNCTFRSCKCTGCLFGPGEIENVTIDNLDTGGLRQFCGTVFRHVVVRGRVGRVMTIPLIDTFPDKYPEAQRDLLQFTNRYYHNTDWALDITNAEFEEAELVGIPARLIRRDPETQVVVMAERVRAGVELEMFANTSARVLIQKMLDHALSDIVLVAAKRSKRFKDDLAVLQALRSAGIAERD